MIPLTLQLTAPHLRPNTLPSPSSSISLSAVVSSSESCHREPVMVDLPSDIDLKVFCGEDNPAGREHGALSGSWKLDVEVLGKDNGMTFEIGASRVDVPCLTMSPGGVEASPIFQPFSINLKDRSGCRVGMLRGCFSARRQGNLPSTPTDSHSSTPLRPTCASNSAAWKSNKIEGACGAVGKGDPAVATPFDEVNDKVRQ